MLRREEHPMPDVMLAIHDSRCGFSPYWIDYCRRKSIPYKVVDCYANDVVKQVRGCDALLWHHSHSDPRDIVIARQIFFALEHAGTRVFPDYRTAWHFDDKVGQKYLFEALGIPSPPTYVFLDRSVALEWAANTDFPKVFKLRHGASSSCVQLVRNEGEARRLIKQAFGRGLPVYFPWDNLKDRLYKWKLGKSDVVELVKGLGRFLYPPRFSKILGRQIGYVLFQDFASGNDSDIRIIVIGDRAFGVRRWVRPGDFRASGSRRFTYDPEQMDVECVALAFQSADKLGGSCIAFDFVQLADGGFAVIEISYGFIWTGSKTSPGYWDRGLNWRAGEFRPEEWMVDLVLDGLLEA